MKDQVSNLVSRGIPSCYIGDDCKQGRIQTDATDASASVKIFTRTRIVNILLKYI
jgi:hypothetical protein